MIKQHYTGNSRRAMNIIWNAAQDYEWDSPFLAFHPNGASDDYLNMVIGLMAKWLDRARITDFFERLGEGPTIDEASVLLWLGIENCVYGKEVLTRPVLEMLRKERAREFFEVNGMLSEQQMSFMSIRVYDQEVLRWSKVLGRKTLPPSPGTAKLAKALEFSPGWNTDEVLEKMHKILDEFFRRKLSDKIRLGKGPGGGFLRSLARTISGRQERRADLLVLRKGSGSGDAKRSVHLTHNPGEMHTSASMQEDRAYIESAFGPCMYTDTEMRILEGNLCVGNDAGCRLWFTDERRSFPEGESLTKETQRLRKDQEEQKRRNEEYYHRHQFRILESIRSLSAQTDVIFQSFLRRLPASSRQGKLVGEKAWRIRVLGDGQTFQTDSDISDASICVDLLLDASQSRMNSQEMIAAQALVIARSFEQSHIPVRVTAFRSLRGYTVLQRLKDFGDRRGEGIFRYYAGGWNRDALCLKAMEYLMAEEQKQDRAKNRILLVLTDANPNDSMQLPSGGSGMFAREYEGDAAVQDAARVVRMITQDRIHIGALYYGASSHLDNVHQIYGQRYERVKTISQLPDAVSELLRRSLSEMTGL